MTYLDVANHLDLTEASVKRLFSQEDISLRRLDSICQMLEIDLSHLTRTNDTDTRALVMLTEAQEIEIVSDERQLAVSFLVLNGWTYDELLKYFDFDEPELIQRLAKLDRLKLIELLPKNRIKLRVAPNLTWLKNGPIQRFFVAHFQSPFMENHFNKENEFLRFLSGMYSPLTCSMILKKLNDLAAEIDQLNQQDRNLTFEERVPFGVLLAIRPWHAEFFENLRR
jgi:DNA-binding Xre family transcriptional regulator